MVLAVSVSIDGLLVRAETTIGAVGATVVAVSTVLADMGVQHSTTYVGARGASTTAVTLLQGPGGTIAGTREFDGQELPVTHARDLLLLDHAAELQAALAERTGALVTIDVSPAALAAARTAYPSPAEAA